MTWCRLNLSDQSNCVALTANLENIFGPTHAQHFRNQPCTDCLQAPVCTTTQEQTWCKLNIPLEAILVWDPKKTTSRGAWQRARKTDPQNDFHCEIGLLPRYPSRLQSICTRIIHLHNLIVAKLIT